MSINRVLIAVALLSLGACAGEAWPGGIQARLVWSQAQGVRVIDTPEDGAAARAGLQVGDRIVAIEGQPVQSLTPTEVHHLLSGEVGTWVEVTVERGEEWIALRIERAPYAPATGR